MLIYHSPKTSDRMLGIGSTLAALSLVASCSLPNTPDPIERSDRIHDLTTGLIAAASTDIQSNPDNWKKLDYTIDNSNIYSHVYTNTQGYTYAINVKVSTNSVGGRDKIEVDGTEDITDVGIASYFGDTVYSTDGLLVRNKMEWEKYNLVLYKDTSELKEEWKGDVFCHGPGTSYLHYWQQKLEATSDVSDVISDKLFEATANQANDVAAKILSQEIEQPPLPVVCES